MTSDEAISLIEETIRESEAAAFDRTVDGHEGAGNANPVLAARDDWQGNDNGIVYGTFSGALADLIEHDEVPTGVEEFDPERWDSDGVGDKREHLIEALGNSEEIGRGQPIAYIGVGGYFTLIRESVTPPQVAIQVESCLPDRDDFPEEAAFPEEID